jgi:micrococcal nuclease
MTSYVTKETGTKQDKFLLRHMSGFELLLELNPQANTPEVAVIILARIAWKSLADVAKIYGPMAFLMKRATVMSWCKSSRRPLPRWDRLEKIVENKDQATSTNSGETELMRLMRYVAVALLLFLVHPSGAFASFTGPVVSVLDGETIEVLHNTHPERVRLSGIDCPEKGQAFGNNAKQASSALVFGKDVLLQTHGQDKYGRTLGDVFLLDGTNMNHELVKHGWCWWYRKYAPGDTVLEGLEKEAREAKKGLWAEPAPVPPWKWRRLRAVTR